VRVIIIYLVSRPAGQFVAGDQSPPTGVSILPNIPMPDFEIIPFSESHLDAAVGLSQAVGWPHRRDDWAMLIPFSNGVVAIEDDQVVGTALRSAFGTGLSTVNMIIVAEALRSQGLGRALTTAAMDNADSRAFRLVATASGRPLYEKLGFEYCTSIVQHQGTLPQAPASGRSRAAGARDLDIISKLESDACGADRSALVQWLATNGTLAVIESNGMVNGFAACRRFGRGFVIGPVVASDAADAQDLITHCMHNLAGQFVRLDVIETSGLGEWLSELGLEQVDRAPVMQHGEASLTTQRIALFSQAFA
jgi:ribosomal protein S18 acetylase RimI-like enzyme